VAAGGALSKGIVRTVGGQAAYRELVPSHVRGLVMPQRPAAPAEL
jgi:hypothetical protein